MFIVKQRRGCRRFFFAHKPNKTIYRTITANGLKVSIVFISFLIKREAWQGKTDFQQDASQNIVQRSRALNTQKLTYHHLRNYNT